MNKAPIILSMAIIFAMSGFNIANAATTQTQQQPQRPPFGEFQGPPPLNEGFGSQVPQEHFGNHQQHMNRPFPSKAEMEAKKAEIDKRLNLSEKQKQQIEKQKQEDIAKIKPIFEQMKQKRQEFKTVMEDKTLSQETKEKKINELKDDMKTLRNQADTLRKENMNSFENILTEKQKKEFSIIKEEQKKEMAQRRSDFGRPPFPQNK